MGNTAISRLPARVREAFVSCFLLGMLTHLYAYTNIIPNADGLSRVYELQQMTVSGRWFLHYASYLHGFIQAPGLIGALTMALLAASAGLTVDLLGIRTTPAAMFTGALMSMFPAVAYTNLYIFTASAYALGIFLAALSVWLTCRDKKWLPAAALILACAIGTYQAYFAVAVALALSKVLLDLLDGKALKDLIPNGFRLIGMMLLAAVLYYGILQIFLKVKNLELLSYLGMSGFSLSGILSSVRKAYVDFAKYFLIPNSAGYNSQLMTALHLLLLAATLWAVFGLVKKQKTEPARLALLSIGAALLPLACNFTQLLSDVTPLMRYSWVLLYVLALAIVDRLDWKLPNRTLAAALTVLLLLFAQIDNTCYTVTQTAHRATQLFLTNLVSRVESTPGYQKDMPVIVIGAYPDQTYPNGVEGFAPVVHYSCLPTTVATSNKHIYYYLNDWVNVPWAEPSQELQKEISESEAFQAMPLYPSDGSVQIIDNQIIVKLAEAYTPKQPYEIAYENRR